MTTASLSVVSLPRRSSAASLQSQLKEAEAQLDLSASHAGELIGKTIRAAEEAGLHRTAIQRMLLRLTAMLDKSLKAQWDLQMFHQQCREQLKKLNVEELGWGDTSPTPSMEPEHFQAAEAEAAG